MVYVMSDIHGEYCKYKKMLEVIDFNDDDDLFILGDIVDRGPMPVDILYDMSMRGNVFPIMGNHEHMAMYLLRKLDVEITEENAEGHLDANDIKFLSVWLQNGGETTIKNFRKYGKEEREELLDYFDEFTPYEEINVGGRDFVLVHGGLPGFSPGKPLSEYDETEMYYTVTDYGRVYYSDKILITGHIPTFGIDKEYDGRIMRKNNHIAIDCGASYGKKLGCIRLDDMKEFYV